MVWRRVALREEGVDRNNQMLRMAVRRKKSPSARRAWIEIDPGITLLYALASPSARRAWIEISFPCPRPAL